MNRIDGTSARQLDLDLLGNPTPVAPAAVVGRPNLRVPALKLLRRDVYAELARRRRRAQIAARHELTDRAVTVVPASRPTQVGRNSVRRPRASQARPFPPHRRRASTPSGSSERVSSRARRSTAAATANCSDRPRGHKSNNPSSATGTIGASRCADRIGAPFPELLQLAVDRPFAFRKQHQNLAEPQPRRRRPASPSRGSRPGSTGIRLMVRANHRVNGVSKYSAAPTKNNSTKRAVGQRRRHKKRIDVRLMVRTEDVRACAGQPIDAGCSGIPRTARRDERDALDQHEHQQCPDRPPAARACQSPT